MTTPHPTIRVVNHWGDLDDIHDLYVIGPYPDHATRDRDLMRIAALESERPEMTGAAMFEASTVPPHAARFSAPPLRLAAAVCLEQVVTAFYGDPECGTCQDRPSLMAPGGCPECHEIP